MTKEQKKLHCSGCYKDFYNGVGAKECWCLDDAKLVLKKEVHIDQIPPWKQKPRKFLSCYNRQQYIYLEHDLIC